MQIKTILLEGKQAAYGASKAALAYYTRCLAEEVGPDGIRVNSVAPGFTETGRVKAASARIGFANKPSESPLGRMGEPGDLADAVAFLLSIGAALHHRPHARGGRRP